jgi:hypothetical protein
VVELFLKENALEFGGLADSLEALKAWPDSLPIRSLDSRFIFL